MSGFKSHHCKLIFLLSMLVLLLFTFFLTIVVGPTTVTFEQVIASFYYYDDTVTEHIIIRHDRLPRAIIAIVIGAALAIAGSLMQALTRNPLASPSIFGINTGAVFFVVIAIVFFSVHSLVQLMWFAFIGAAISASLVYFLGSLGRDGLTPVKIVLAGAAISALFHSYTQAVLVMNEAGLQDVLFWLAGSVSGRTLDMLLPVLPFMFLAALIALFMGRAINLLITGDEVAKGMGQNVGAVKLIMGVIVVVLAGSSVAVAGSIGFVGLVVPHLTRAVTGNDYRWQIPMAALIGAILLLTADVVARIVIMPQEIPIGVVTAVIGAPFFIYISRRGLTKL
ncbi:FecCD family ABC transporter permease [Salipaludibacillus agaradhaerens]|uniref:FecCD family ABC transporter permease n=1 Tax=Salipaludibacillus agaradhaerens TaxID=76935 RepID=UPI0009974A08|nr:iron ABC transporter permease [Salipaludibacillus agaradhaerens]